MPTPKGYKADKPEDEGEEKPDEGSEESSPPKKKGAVDEAKEILTELKTSVAGLGELRDLVERAEKLKAENVIGGESEAGTEKPAEDADKKIKDECNKFLKVAGHSI